MNHLFEKLIKMLSLDIRDQSYIRITHETNVRQLPFMYLIIAINCLMIAYSLFDQAPRWATLGVSIVILCVCILRARKWRLVSKTELSIEEQYKQLKTIRANALLFTCLLLGWALMLYDYGDVYSRMQIQFYMSITFMSVVLCLFHFPSAALPVLVTGLGIFLLTFGWSGARYDAQAAFNMTMVTITMVHLLRSSQSAQRQLLQANADLKQKNDETAALSEHNRFIAHHDSLTSVLNRRGFFEALGKLEASKGAEEKICLGLIDLDGFKAANDLYGHGVGDGVLIEASKRINEYIGDQGFVGRLGGDEFGFVLYDDLPNLELQTLGDRICTSLSLPYPNLEQCVRISASLGMTRTPRERFDNETIYERTDLALYYAKRQKTGGAVLFTKDLESAIMKDAEVQLALRHADLNTEMSILFQPIFDATNREIVCVEALARWENPHLGRISPAIFIPQAEQSGMISRLTLCLFEKALHEAQKLPKHIKVSFNLSAYDIALPQMQLQLLAAIHRARFDTRRIIFEITETALLHDFDITAQAIAHLRQAGCHIALDDFGVGYSSLAYIEKLDFDKLKLDGSFVRTIITNQKSREIARMVIGMCERLGVDCVVEGVENEEELRTIRSIGATYIQGYHLSRPKAMDNLLNDFSLPEKTRASA